MTTQPLVTVSTTPVGEEKDLFFTIDEVDYYLPREIPGNVAMDGLALADEIGEAQATVKIMERVLGADAVRALRTCPTLRKEELLAIQRIIRERVFGPVEEEGKG